MRYPYHLLDVFTDRVFGGNQLAVFPDARGLSDPQMQRVAAELNLSETVFVFPPETAAGTRRVRIFTPGKELPFAGHPTVGTCVLLAALGEVPMEDGEARIVLEEGVGPVPVTVRKREGRPLFAQLSAAKMPEWGPPPPPREALAAIVGLHADDVLEDDWAPAAVSCGVPFLVLPVRSREALGRVRLDLGRWETVLGGYWAPDLYLVTPDGGADGVDLRARMFAPDMGIAEDPATGAAASALAGYLARRSGESEGTLRWTVHQGVEMGRPSELRLEADLAAGEVKAVRVGGEAVRVGEGVLDIPEE